MPQDFFVVLSVAEVTRRLKTFAPLPAETAALEDPRGLEGRVLAADVTARDDVPLTNRSGMDGYAVQAADVFGASEGNPVYLTRVGRIAVDRPADFSLEPGQCAAIVTGGVFQGAGSTLVPTLFNLGTMWGIRLPLAWLAAPRWGLPGVWTAMCVELCVRGTLYLVRLSGKRWLPGGMENISEPRETHKM